MYIKYSLYYIAKDGDFWNPFWDYFENFLKFFYFRPESGAILRPLVQTKSYAKKTPLPLVTGYSKLLKLTYPLVTFLRHGFYRFNYTCHISNENKMRKGMLLLGFYFCQIDSFEGIFIFDDTSDGIVVSYFSYSIYEIFWSCFVPYLN